MHSTITRFPCMVCIRGSLFAWALNSVLWKFFFIWSLIYFPHEFMKTTWSWLCMYSRGKNFKSRKKSWKFTFSNIFFFLQTYYFDKRHDMKQCRTFKIIFEKIPAILDTLVCIIEFRFIEWQISYNFVSYALVKAYPYPLNYTLNI